MGSSTPIRIENDLYRAAQEAARSSDRSAAQQIAYWARLGRELEASRTISVGAINDVLDGRRSYDTIEAEDQAVVRAVWRDRLDRVAGGINLAAQFAAVGRRTWIDITPDGTIVRRGPGVG